MRLNTVKQLKNNNVISEIEREVLNKFKFPLKYDNECQSVVDSDNRPVCDVRSWGYFQKFDNPELLHDTLGEIITKTLNEKYNKQIKNKNK